MTVAVMMPDATQLVADWLRDRLDGVQVVSRVPNPRPERFVLVRRVGGVKRTKVSDEPMLTVEAWGATEAQAMDLLRDARYQIQLLPGNHGVYRVAETGGPGFLPDPLSTEPRATMTVLVHVRGSKP